LALRDQFAEVDLRDLSDDQESDTLLADEDWTARPRLTRTDWYPAGGLRQAEAILRGAGAGARRPLARSGQTPGARQVQQQVLARRVCSEGRGVSPQVAKETGYGSEFHGNWRRALLSDVDRVLARGVQLDVGAEHTKEATPLPSRSIARPPPRVTAGSVTIDHDNDEIATLRALFA
jgi:hypothetical protein